MIWIANCFIVSSIALFRLAFLMHTLICITPAFFLETRLKS
jgi:hypothetical protein